jgi:hypothetical protein
MMATACLDNLTFFSQLRVFKGLCGTIWKGYELGRLGLALTCKHLN